ncbi:unnamed protein product [Allacma fusca]|uniref:Uncharacterized protein n=1 Tax=Allacma fusca TaxID=39272 RepID=A0A8J2PGE6_9HEXA|nr:unnamed protein product [Allacma fusca]
MPKDCRKLPRQTLWSRKNRNNSKQIPGLLFGNVNNLFGEDGAVLALDESWDVSSISDEDNNENLSDSSEILDESRELQFDQPASDPISDINLESKLYEGCSLTLTESLSLVSAFVSKFNLKKNALEGLLQLLKLHIPDSVYYPTTEYKFNRHLAPTTVFVNKHYFCGKCNSHVENTTCKNCKLSLPSNFDMRNNHMFAVLDIRKQLEIVLQSTDVMDVLDKFHSRSTTTNSSSSNNNNMDLTFTLNTVGVPLFRSSGKSLWPILMTCNELPLYLKKRYFICAAIWSGKKKIDPFLVFPPVIKQLNSLQEIPVKWKNLANESNHKPKWNNRSPFVLECGYCEAE